MSAFIHQTPFLRILIPFVAGIIAAHYGLTAECLRWTLIPLSAVIIILNRQAKHIHRKRQWLFGLAFNLFMFATGLTAFDINRYTPVTMSDKGLYAVVLSDAPVERERSVRATAVVQCRMAEGAWHNDSEKFMLYLRKDSAALALRQGDLLMAEMELKPVVNGGNPHEFDYAGYLARRRISRSAFVDSGQWTLVRHLAQRPFANMLNRARTYLLNVFIRAGLDGNEQAVASALVLGFRGYMGDELLTAYSSSGAMHILAVSGMHVGVFYLIISFLLGKIRFLQRQRSALVVLTLSLLWLYAFIAGMTPSISRAALMFSIIAIGLGFRRRSNTYNSIAASAFILLLLNPTSLFEVSFQLSYAAVLAIVIIQPRLFIMFNFSNKLLNNIWALICTSLAAQLGTAPLALLYFNQFPTYFLLTNLVAVPMASVIMYGAAVLFVLSPVGAALNVAGWLFEKLIYGLNACIFFIEKLPGSVIQNIGFDERYCLLAYTIIIFTMAWIILRRTRFMLAALAACLLWLMMSVGNDLQTLTQRQLIVYNTSGNTVVQTVEGDKSVIWQRTRNDVQRISALTEATNIALRLKEVQTEPLDSAHNLIRVVGKRLLIIDRDHRPEQLTGALTADIALLTQNVNADIALLAERCKPTIIVIDASNSPKRADTWAKQCAELGIACHNTAKQGAYIFYE